MSRHFSDPTFSFRWKLKENRKAGRFRLITHALMHAFLTFGLLFSLTIAATAAKADARNLIASVELLKDQSRILSAEDVLALPTQTVEPEISIGFTKAVLWFKIKINPPHIREKVVLKVFPNVLDNLELYQIDRAGRVLPPIRSGDVLPLSQRHVPSFLSHDFILPLTSESTTYLLRIDTRSGAMLSLVALPANEAAAQTLYDLLFSSLSMGVKFFSVILLVLYGAHLPRRINLVFAATIATFGLIPLIRFGYLQAAFPNISPQAIGYLTSVALTLSVGVLLLFLRLFMTPFAPRRVTLILTNAAIAVNLVALPVLMTGAQQTANIISTAMLSSVVPVAGFMLLTLRRDAYIGRHSVRLIYGTFLLLIFRLMSINFGLMKPGEFYRFSIEVVGIANSTLILALILMLNLSIKRRRQEAELRSMKLNLESEALSRTRSFQKRLIDAISEQSQITENEIRSLSAAESQHGKIPVVLEQVMGRIRTIIGHCQQAGRIEEGEWRVDISSVDLAVVLSQLAQDIAPERFRLSIPATMVARCDRSLIEVALGHLMSNASRYSAPDTPITVTAQSADQDMVKVIISNDFSPKSKFEPDRLFEKFYRGPDGQSKSGTGLGLFIAREILTALGGEISASLETGKIHFTVTLPRGVTTA